MGEERFQALAAAFGGDLSRWPREVRSAARRHLARHPEARRILEGEAALDALLEPHAPPAPDRARRALGRRLLARLSSEGGP